MTYIQRQHITRAPLDKNIIAGRCRRCRTRFLGGFIVSRFTACALAFIAPLAPSLTVAPYNFYATTRPPCCWWRCWRRLVLIRR